MTPTNRKELEEEMARTKYLEANMYDFQASKFWLQAIYDLGLCVVPKRPTDEMRDMMRNLEISKSGWILLLESSPFVDKEP